MKILLFTLLAAMVPIAVKAIPTKEITYIVEFDETGKLISEPPAHLTIGDKLVFKVAVSKMMIEKRALDVYKSYFNVYQNMRDTQAYLDSNRIRGSECFVEKVKSELIAEMQAIINTYPTIVKSIKTVKSPPTTAFDFRSCIGLGHGGRFVPQADNLIVPSYTVITSAIGENGVAIKETTTPIATFNVADFSSNPNTAFSSAIIPVAAETFRVRFELRQINNYYQQILDLLAANPLPIKLNEGFSELKKYEEKYKKAKAFFESPIFPLGDLNKHDAALNEGVIYMKAFIDTDIVRWLLHFVWLNEGQMLANPFVFATKSVRNVEVDGATDSLQVIVNKISLLKELLKNETQLRTYATLKIDDYLNKYHLLQEEESRRKLVLDGRQKANKKAKGAVEKENKKINDHNNRLLREPWLYAGLIYVSDSVFTRYHDASDSYKLMNESPVKEIVDGQKLVLLVENERPANKLKVIYEAKSIDFSLSFLEEAISKASSSTRMASFLENKSVHGFTVLTKSFRDPNTTLAASFANKLTLFATEYNNLKLFTDRIFKEGVADLPLQSERDSVPNFTYKYLDVAVGKSPPYEVPYSIGLVRTGKADTILTDAKLNLTYSVFALHRFRFKIGPAYSSFRKQSFEIKDGIPLATTEVAGVDAIFGLQVFLTPKRINIRTKDFSLRRPFTYLGFPINADIIKNVYIGGGFELLNGLGLCVGLQIGQTARLRYQSGTFTVDNNRWRAGGPFASILLDISVFRTLFNFQGLQLPNPFRSL